MTGIRQCAAGLRAKHQVSHVHIVPAYGAAIPRDEPIENSACLREHPYLGANEHQTGLPYAPGCAGGNFLYLWCQCVQSAKVAIQRKHLRTIDTVRIVATSLLTDLEQLFNPAFQTDPVAAQQRQCHAMGTRLVLMQS